MTEKMLAGAFVEKNEAYIFKRKISDGKEKDPQEIEKDEDIYVSEGEIGDIKAEDLREDKRKPEKDAKPMESWVFKGSPDGRGDKRGSFDEKSTHGEMEKTSEEGEIGSESKKQNKKVEAQGNVGIIKKELKKQSNERRRSAENSKEGNNFDEISQALEEQADKEMKKDKKSNETMRSQDSLGKSERNETGAEIESKPENANGKERRADGIYESREEDPKIKAEKAYAELIKSQRRFNRAKKNYNIWRNIMRKVKGSIANVLNSSENKIKGIEKRAEEKVQVKEEYNEAKKKLAEDKIKWKKAFEEYCSSVIIENKDKILERASTAGSKNFWKEAMAFMVGEKIVDMVKEKVNERGEKENMQYKVSLIEDYNNRIRGLENLKIDSIDDETKQALNTAKRLSAILEDFMIFFGGYKENFKEAKRLGEGGTIWNTLTNEIKYFNRDWKKAASAFLKFRREIAYSLIKKHNMDKARAERFIEWKLTGNMRPHDRIIVRKDGSIFIEGFEDEEIFELFNALHK